MFSEPTLNDRGRSLLLMFAVLCVLSLIGLALVETAWLGRGSEPALLVVLAALCTAHVAHGWITRSFDPFEPILPIVIATAIYFVLMPVVIMAVGSARMLGIDYREEMPAAMCLAALALAAFSTGYYGHRSAGYDLSSIRRNAANPSRTYAAALVLFALASAMFVAWVAIARIPLQTLNIFSGAGYGAWIGAAAGPNLGHLYAAQEAWPACVLLMVGSHPARRWSIASGLALLAVIAIYACLGVRARILLAVGSAVAFHYLHRGLRPSLLKLGLVGVAIFTLVIGTIGYYRGPASYRKAESVGLSSAWTHLVDGSDIATTTAAYVHWLRRYGYESGRNFLAVALLPVPHAVWPEKYKLLRVSPIEKHKAVGSAAPCFVEFYRSFGSPALVFGAAVLGWFSRRVYERSRANPRDVFAQASLALLWAYSFHMYGRDSVTLLVGGCVFVFGPVWVCRRVSEAFSRLTVMPPIPRAQQPERPVAAFRGRLA